MSTPGPAWTHSRVKNLYKHQQKKLKEPPVSLKDLYCCTILHSFLVYSVLCVCVVYKHFVLEAFFSPSIIRIPHKFFKFHSTRPYQRTENDFFSLSFLSDLTFLCNLIITPNTTRIMRGRLEDFFSAARIRGLGGESVWRRQTLEAVWKPNRQLTGTG